MLTLRPIGYRVRGAISKHIKSRGEAIRSAVRKLNAAAANLDPPRPKVSISTVLDTAFLSEFDLLRDSRQDVRQKEWAKPAMRVLIDNYFKWIRAAEEIERLNVEIPRLVTWMRDEAAVLARAVASVAEEDPSLAFELRRRLTAQNIINARITAKLEATARLHGFTGSLECGTGEYSAASTSNTVPASVPVPGSSGGQYPLHAEPSRLEDDQRSIGTIEDEAADGVDELEAMMAQMAQ